MAVTNTGSDAFDFQAALHSYFRCSDINKVGDVCDMLNPFFFLYVLQPRCSLNYCCVLF